MHEDGRSWNLGSVEVYACVRRTCHGLTDQGQLPPERLTSVEGRAVLREPSIALLVVLAMFRLLVGLEPVLRRRAIAVV